MGSEHRLHRVYLLDSRKFVTTKHVSSDQHQFPFLKQSKQNPVMTVQNESHVYEQNEAENGMNLMDRNIDEETRNDRNVVLSKRKSKEADNERNASQETVKKPMPSFTQARNEPRWFKIAAIPRTSTKNERSVKEALDRDVNEACKSAKSAEERTLQQMCSWDIFNRFKNDGEMHNKYMLNRKGGEKGQFVGRKLSLWYVEMRKYIVKEDIFSSVGQYFINKVIFYLSLQRGWTARHVAFDSFFGNRQMEGPVHDKGLNHCG